MEGERASCLRQPSVSDLGDWVGEIQSRSLDSGAGLSCGRAGVEGAAGHSSGMSKRSLDIRVGTSARERTQRNQRGWRSQPESNVGRGKEGR